MLVSGALMTEDRLEKLPRSGALWQSIFKAIKLPYLTLHIISLDSGTTEQSFHASSIPVLGDGLDNCSRNANQYLQVST